MHNNWLLVGAYSIPEGSDKACKGLWWTGHSKVRPGGEVEVADATLYFTLKGQNFIEKINSNSEEIAPILIKFVLEIKGGFQKNKLISPLTLLTENSVTTQSG